MFALTDNNIVEVLGGHAVMILPTSRQHSSSSENYVDLSRAEASCGETGQWKNDSCVWELRVTEDHSVWAEQCSGFLCCDVNKPFSPLSRTQRAVIYMEVME